MYCKRKGWKNFNINTFSKFINGINIGVNNEIIKIDVKTIVAQSERERSSQQINLKQQRRSLKNSVANKIKRVATKFRNYWFIRFETKTSKLTIRVEKSGGKRIGAYLRIKKKNININLRI